MQVTIKDHVIFLDKTEKIKPWVVVEKNKSNFRKAKYFNTFEAAFEHLRQIYYPDNKVNSFVNVSYYIMIGMIIGAGFSFLITDVL